VQVAHGLRCVLGNAQAHAERDGDLVLAHCAQQSCHVAFELFEHQAVRRANLLHKAVEEHHAVVLDALQDAHLALKVIVHLLGFHGRCARKNLLDSHGSAIQSGRAHLAVGSGAQHYAPVNVRVPNLPSHADHALVHQR